MKNLALALGLMLPAVGYAGKTLPNVPSDCMDDIELQSYCASTKAPIFKGPVKVAFFVVVGKSEFPSVESAVERYMDFDAWADYVAASGQDNVEIDLSTTLDPIPAKEGSNEVFRQYSAYRMKAPVVGWQEVRAVSHNYEVPAYDGALTSVDFVIQNSGSQEVPVGEAPLNGSEGVKSQTGSLHVVSCEKSELCSEDQMLLIYESTITPDIDILPSVAAGAIKDAIGGIVIGMFLELGAGDGEVL